MGLSATALTCRCDVNFKGSYPQLKSKSSNPSVTKDTIMEKARVHLSQLDHPFQKLLFIFSLHLERNTGREGAILASVSKTLLSENRELYTDTHVFLLGVLSKLEKNEQAVSSFCREEGKPISDESLKVPDSVTGRGSFIGYVGMIPFLEAIDQVFTSDDQRLQAKVLFVEGKYNEIKSPLEKLRFLGMVGTSSLQSETKRYKQGFKGLDVLTLRLFMNDVMNLLGDGNFKTFVDYELSNTVDCPEKSEFMHLISSSWVPNMYNQAVVLDDNHQIRLGKRVALVDVFKKLGVLANDYRRPALPSDEGSRLGGGGTKPMPDPNLSS